MSEPKIVDTTITEDTQVQEPTAQDAQDTATPAVDTQPVEPAKQAKPAAAGKQAKPAAAKQADQPKADDAPAKEAEATAEPKPDGEDAGVKLSKLEQALLHKSAEAAAALAGVRPDRVQYVKALALQGITSYNQDTEAALQAAVAKVLQDIPELIGGAGTGSVGNFARKDPAGSAKIAMEAEVAKSLGCL